MARPKEIFVLELHPSIARLAKAMQSKLDRDEQKGPWQRTPLNLLHNAMLNEMAELTLTDGEWHAEAADVANFAMMYADAAEAQRGAQRDQA